MRGERSVADAPHGDGGRFGHGRLGAREKRCEPRVAEEPVVLDFADEVDLARRGGAERGAGDADRGIGPLAAVAAAAAGGESRGEEEEREKPASRRRVGGACCAIPDRGDEAIRSSSAHVESLPDGASAREARRGIHFKVNGAYRAPVGGATSASRVAVRRLVYGPPMTKSKVFETKTIDELVIDDERSFRHVAIYGELAEVLRKDRYPFRLLPERFAGRWDRGLFLNLTFWGSGNGGDVLETEHIPADVVAHVAWHHLAARALRGPASKEAAAQTVEALFLGEAIASAFDVYLIGRLLGHSPRSSFLESQVPAMAEAANAAGVKAAAFEKLLGRIAGDPGVAFEGPAVAPVRRRAGARRVRIGRGGAGDARALRRASLRVAAASVRAVELGALRARVRGERGGMRGFAPWTGRCARRRGGGGLAGGGVGGAPALA